MYTFLAEVYLIVLQAKAHSLLVFALIFSREKKIQLCTGLPRIQFLPTIVADAN